MQLSFLPRLAAAYTSPLQRIRVMSEHWVRTNVYCPNCGRVNIDKYTNNRPVGDFFCASCKEDYELKSQKGQFGNRITDGAYRTMVECLHANKNPNFFLLNYDFPTLRVVNLLIIPKHFFTPQIIQKRNPLSETARRAGWTGCNILLQQIPHSGRIYLIKNRVVEAKAEVLDKWKKTLFLREQKDTSAKGWLLNVMRCVEKLNRETFSLDDVYLFEHELKQIYPGNRHVKEKIRQQLQVLRDKGYLEFIGRASYRLRKVD